MISALKLVAADFNEQISALPSFVAHTDEIALDYDDAYQRIAGSDGIVPNKTMRILRELDALFDRMSADKSLWTVDRLREDETWAKSRLLARQALENWGFQQGPPDAIGTYVRGL